MSDDGDQQKKQVATSRRPTITAYVDPHLKLSFQQLVADVSRKTMTVKESTLAELAIREFLEKYQGNEGQLRLEF